MEIFNVIHNISANYSKKDLRFECLEISVLDCGIVDYRVYTKNAVADSIEYNKLPPVINNLVKNFVLNNPEFYFLDFSERKNNQYSVGFELKPELDLRELSERIEFSYDLKCLTTYGYLIDSNCDILQTKEYYKVSSIDNELIDRLINRNLFNLICENKYQPFLYGINKKNTEDEEKLYFISSVTDSDRNEISYALNIVSVMNLSDLIDSILKEAYRNGLWLRGFAYSNIKNEDTWRLYLFRT